MTACAKELAAADWFKLKQKFLEANAGNNDSDTVTETSEEATVVGPKDDWALEQLYDRM